MVDVHLRPEVLASEAGPKLYRYFATWFSADLADDLVQETLLRVWQAIRSGKYSSQRANWLTFAYGVARNIRYEHLRKMRGGKKEYSFSKMSDSNFQGSNISSEGNDSYQSGEAHQQGSSQFEFENYLDNMPGGDASELFTDPNAPSLEDKVVEKIMLKEIRKALFQLKDEEREALGLLVDRDLKLTEIAEIMHMPVGTVKSHIFRARENLKRILSENNTVPREMLQGMS